MLSRFYISKRIVKKICLITKMVQIVMTLCSITMPTGKIFCFFTSTIKNKAISCCCVMRERVWLGFAKDAGQGFWLFSASALVKA